MPTGQTPGHLSRPIKRPATMDRYAAQGGYVLVIHLPKVAMASRKSLLDGT